MAGSKSFMNENAREIVVSTDLTRIGKLAAKEQQDAEKARNARADFFVPGAFDDFGPTARTAAAEVITGAIATASLQGQAGTFDMLLGAGEAQVLTNDVQPDGSLYQVARWAAQSIPWPSAANPDGSLYRVATIYCSPTNELDDLVSRNILLNPATRTFAPQNVYKTSNPSAVVAVLGGTPDASLPMPPALPANTIALFDVLIPPGSTQSSDWQITRRCSRRIEFPGSSQHGILKGCKPEWHLTDEATGSPAFIPLGFGGSVHRLVIDGELLTFSASSPGAFIVASGDTGAGALTAAPATHDLPYYLYLCGGRNFPFCGGVTGATANPYNATPVVLVASLTPPDYMGYPTSALGVGTHSIPRNAAVYVGVGFLVANTLVHKCCHIEDDWIYAATGNQSLSAINPNAGFNEVDVALSTAGQDVEVNTIPAISSMLEAEAVITVTPTAAGGTFAIIAEPDAPAYFGYDQQVAFGVEVTDGAGNGQLRLGWRGLIPTSSMFFVQPMVSGSPTLAVNLYAKAYNMNVPRLAR